MSVKQQNIATVYFFRTFAIYRQICKIHRKFTFCLLCGFYMYLFDTRIRFIIAEEYTSCGCVVVWKDERL